MKVGDRVELIMPLVDVCVGVCGTITDGPGTAEEGWLDAFMVRFDDYDRVRCLMPTPWLRRLTVLDLIVDALRAEGEAA